MQPTKPLDPEGVHRREESLQQSMATFGQALEIGINRLNAPGVTLEEQSAAITAIHRSIVRHVNEVESCIAQDDLTGATSNPRWHAYRAETSINLLEVYLEAYALLRQWCDCLEIPAAQFKPSRTALAGIQRIVRDHSPADADELCEQFKSKGLPTRGFDMSVPRPPPYEESGASVIFAPTGGVSQVNGVTSRDATVIATGIVHKGSTAFSAPASPSEAATLFNASNTGKEPSWLQLQWKEIKAAPVKIFIAAAGSVILGLTATLIRCV